MEKLGPLSTHNSCWSLLGEIISEVRRGFVNLVNFQKAALPAARYLGAYVMMLHKCLKQMIRVTVAACLHCSWEVPWNLGFDNAIDWRLLKKRKGSWSVLERNIFKCKKSQKIFKNSVCTVLGLSKCWYLVVTHRSRISCFCFQLV